MRLRDRLTSLADSDRGASAVLVAASLVMLMGFAALAVDSGVGFNDRRQQASAADVGALAALQFAKTTLATTHPDCIGLTGKDRSACRGAEEVLAVVDGTLPGRYDDADWGACVDANPGGYSRASAISKCIRFTPDLRRSRVVLPGTDVETAFGKAIGFSTIRVSAFAEAGLEQNISGGVLPFALGPSGAGSNQACFFSGDNPILDSEPCKKSVQGNFGKLNVRWYGNELYGAPSPECSGQNAWRMSMNIITGTDHPLELESKNPGIVNDNTNCDNIANPVDQVETWTGNAAGAIADGMILGVTSPTNYEGRIRCKDGDAAEDYPVFAYTSSACVTVNSSHHPESLDHTPLWQFIKSGAPGTAPGGACAPGQANDRAGMQNCLGWWKSTGPHATNLFTPALATSPRFGGVPKLHSDPLPGSSAAYLITDFTPVYLETMYFKCGPSTCDTVHSPGENTDGSPPAACPTPITSATTSCGWPGNGNKAIEAITAFILTLDMLPDEIGDNFPYQDGTIVYNLFR